MIVDVVAAKGVDGLVSLIKVANSLAIKTNVVALGYLRAVRWCFPKISGPHPR